MVQILDASRGRPSLLPPVHTHKQVIQGSPPPKENNNMHNAEHGGGALGSTRATDPSGRSLSKRRLQSTTGPPDPIRSLDWRLTGRSSRGQQRSRVSRVGRAVLKLRSYWPLGARQRQRRLCLLPTIWPRTVSLSLGPSLFRSSLWSTPRHRRKNSEHIKGVEKRKSYFRIMMQLHVLYILKRGKPIGTRWLLCSLNSFSSHLTNFASV